MSGVQRDDRGAKFENPGVHAACFARPFVLVEGAKRILYFAFTTDPATAAKAR
ncbi:MAG TPA: hypothetical protein VMU78_08300 [Methylocella sp.]|nr:hypothetical protein [Methylocella sp.]